MRLIAIAEELHRELGAPVDLSQALITFWLRENVGLLNNLIHQDYIIDSTNYEISPELGENEKTIYKKLYLIDYYDRQIRTNMGAAAWDATLEVTSDGATVRKANKNEIAKTFTQLRNAHMTELTGLINGYKKATIMPKQVVGDDYIEADIPDE